MNIHVCQDKPAISEVQNLLTMSETFISSQDSKPMLTLKQDIMTGWYKLTYGTVYIPIPIYLDAISVLEQDYIEHKIQHISKVINFSHFNEEGERDPKWFTGYTLMSFLLPDDFEYFCHNEMSPDGKPVKITEGVMISGTVDKKAIGNSSGSLMHHLAKDYGNEFAANFVTQFQWLVNDVIQHLGFSVGLEDFIPSNLDLVETESNKCFLEAFHAIQTERDIELLERKVSGALNKASGIGQKVAKDALKSDNNMVSMVRCGAKGSWFNVSQVVGLIGQQYVSGSRIPKLFGGRTLAHYPRTSYISHIPDILPKINTTVDTGDDDDLKTAIRLFESRGFCRSSYYRGLTPGEFFFHAAGGREGLIDTACKTRVTGYSQRKMTKILEDLQIGYNGTVNTSSGRVIQFSYGGDNMDAARLIRTKKGMSFVDIEHAVSKINRQIERNNEIEV